MRRGATYYYYAYYYYYYEDCLVTHKFFFAFVILSRTNSANAGASLTNRGCWLLATASVDEVFVCLH